jgi:MFS superfamily sulfate permease-like transporter
MNLFNTIKTNLRFDKNEFSGSIGDIGTDLPLILGMILASGIDAASVFIVYGFMQIFSGIFYGIPMAVQPLKAIATIVIAGSISGDLIYTGGFIIGVIMLILTLTGTIGLLAKVIPTVVVRGVQVGLGLTLATISVTKYMLPQSNLIEFGLIILAFALGLFFLGNRKYPPAFFLLALGIMYSFINDFSSTFSLFNDFSVNIPNFNTPKKELFFDALILLALPQIPLSIGNSILASNQLVKDYFPEKKISISKISLTYSIMNLISPFFGGIPVCHGSGGMVGHYNFGARTGGSVFIYGLFFIIIGVFFSAGIQNFLKFIPIQILGVILFFESISLISLIKHSISTKKEIFIVALVAVIASNFPYGFLISMIIGSIVYYLSPKINFLKNDKT